MPHQVPNLEEIESVHLLGIGGTAMAAFAGMLQDAGLRVTGSDTAVYPPMSTVLAGLGIEVMVGYEAKNLAHHPDLAIVGNVIRATYPEAEALLASDIPYCSFPEALGRLFLGETHNVVVAGTHGKTTTTALVAWLCTSAGLDPGFLIGGVARNFDRTARRGAGRVFVVEGDEYDTAFFDKRPKFVHYRPTTAILTSVEFDHADIYRDLAHVEEAFRSLVNLIPADGTLIVRGDDPHALGVAQGARCAVWTYGPGQRFDGRTESVDTRTGRATFTVLRDGEPLGTFESVLVGTHNLYNQVAATAAALAAGVPVEALAAGFASFEGIQRRQEIVGEPGGVTVVDDFAHHPTAVRVTLAALRERFGRRRMWAVWEPRSATSRRAVFQAQYGEAFDDADQVIVAKPFDQSRIEEGDRFDSDVLVRALADRGVDAMTLPDADTIAATLAARAHPHDVIAVLSNGGFDGLHRKLLALLEARFAG